MRVLIIIPAYNEEINILKTVNSVIEYRKNCDFQLDYIVINDGSTDNTYQICRDNNINCINLIQNLGIGGAVQTGYIYANIKDYDIAVQFDGDGQHDISSLGGLIKPIADNESDFVVGSRFISKTNGFKSTFMRRVGIKWLSLCVTTMVRPLIVIVFPCIVAAEIIIKWKNHKEWLRNIGFFILGFIIVATPWWIRNAVTLNQFIPLATQTNPIYAGLAPDVEALGLQDPGTLFGNVILLIKLLFTKPLSTIYWMTLGKFSKIFFDANDLPYLFELCNIVNNTTVVLGIFGFLRALFSKKHRCTAIIFFIYLLSILMFIPVSRYSLGYLPLLAVAAGYLLDTAFQTLKE
ncbi:MAG: glycosyltransferase [Acutalibacteraceae bacterium]